MQARTAKCQASWGVSVVICCHNSAARLPQTLAHLAAQQRTAPVLWEVIVIDNGSTDQTATVARQQWPVAATAPLRVVHEPQLGLIHARLRGFAAARYELVSFIDDDNWVAPDWVVTVAALMHDRPAVGACGGWSVAVSEQPLPAWFARYHAGYAVGEQGCGSGDVTVTRGYLWGAGLTIRQAAWQQLLNAGFRPLLAGRQGTALSGGEDSEICYALRLAGWRLWYDRRLQLQHYLPAHRLEWSYLRQLHRGTGRAFVVLGVYRQLLDLPTNPVGRLKQVWLWQLLGSGVGLLRRQMKYSLSQAPLPYRRFSAAQRVAAERALLDREYYQEKLITLLQKRREYRQMVNRLRALAQQLGKTK